MTFRSLSRRPSSSRIHQPCAATPFLATSMFLALMGCSQGMPVNSHPTSSPTTVSRGIQGNVHGGQQPIGGAKVYLYAVGTTGYGSASTSLLTTSGGYVTTDVGGNFGITGDYSCPSATSLVYLVAMGGDSGSGTNSLVAMTAALGNCQQLLANANTTLVLMNEETTVGMAYALAPFTTSVTAIGAPSSNLQGMTNAFAQAANLVNTSYGLPFSTTPAGNASVPTIELNTLADFIAVCINSAGVVTGGRSTACDMVMTPLTLNTVAPANTFMAAVTLAKNPALSTSSVFQAVAPMSPFQPTLTTAPNDFTVALQYSGGGIATPQSIAIDGSGNAWIANVNNAVTEISGTSGAFLSGTSGYTTGSLDAPSAIAIDTTGSAWIANCGGSCSGSANASSLTLLTPSSGSVAASNFTDASLKGAYSLAIDGSNAVWVANALGVSLTKFSHTGQVLSGTTGYTSTFLANPTSLAIDTAGNAWTTSGASNAVSEISSSGGAGPSSYQGTSVAYPFALAMDSASRAWVVNQSANTLSLVSSSGLVSGSPYSGGGLSSPNALAIDGLGTAWISNANGTLSAFSSSIASLSPTTGYVFGATFANAVAIDGSGSVWVTNCGSYCTGSGSSTGSVYQLIGAAAPVVTPLALSVQNGTAAVRP